MEKGFFTQLEKALTTGNALIWELLNIRDHPESTPEERKQADALTDDAQKIKDAIEGIARARAGK